MNVSRLVTSPGYQAQVAAQAIRNAQNAQALSGDGAAAAGVGVALLAILAVPLALRGWAGHYVGKQFARPKSGAVVGAIFGAPGMGLLSLFPGDKKTTKKGSK